MTMHYPCDGEPYEVPESKTEPESSEEQIRKLEARLEAADKNAQELWRRIHEKEDQERVKPLLREIAQLRRKLYGPPEGPLKVVSIKEETLGPIGLVKRLRNHGIDRTARERNG